MNMLRKLWRSSSLFSRLCVAIPIGFSIYAFSSAEVTFRDFGLAVVVFPAWGILWLFRLLIWLATRNRAGAKQFEEPRLAWSFEPIVCAVLIGLISINGFMLCRFFLGLPWLRNFAQEKLADAKINGPGRWHTWDGYGYEWLPCGLYQITKWQVSVAEDGSPEVMMITAYHTLTDAAGFAYVPSGGRPSGSRVSGGPSYFDHLMGSWWRWRWDM